MRIFITGASGWIGSAAVVELVAAGHKVVGLARSATSAASITEKGAQVLEGDLDNLDSLRRGAGEADAVIHLAYKHDWAHPGENDRAERAAVETIAGCLAGSDRPFMVAQGIGGLVPGRLATEQDPSPWTGPESPRGGAENLALDSVDRGVGTIIMRFAPTVHAPGDEGFTKALVGAALKHGFSAYVGDGAHGWSAVPRPDVARLIRLGIEGAPAGTRLHGVAEESLTTKSIVEAIGAAFLLPVRSVAPEDAVGHFGFVGRFFSMGIGASSQATRALLGWNPTGPTLFQDIRSGAYR